MLKHYFNLINRVEEEEGQGLVEYALILVLVSIAVILLLTLLGNQIGVVFENVTDALTP